MKTRLTFISHCWWAIESQAGQAAVDKIAKELLSEPTTWQRPLVAQHVAERLMKRYALAGSREDLLSAASLLNSAPDKSVPPSGC